MTNLALRPCGRARGTVFTACSCCALLLAAAAAAQEQREPAGMPLPAYARVRTPWTAVEREAALWSVDSDLPNILVTGYWPPSNEMLRRFSPNAQQNPEGWIGGNWENRGYNIYAFFPEFPNGLGIGVGDFQVDYQATSTDFWNITAQLRPCGLLTFGEGGFDWQIEWHFRDLSYWVNDYLAPTQPTPAPPDASEPPESERHTSLPIGDIATAVNAAQLGLQAWVNFGYPGAFLCEYIGYHAAWYHDLHADPNDPQRCLAAGHIHVGGYVELPRAVAATEITLRTLIAYLDAQRVLPGDLNCDGVVDFADINAFVLRLSDPAGYRQVYPNCPDGNGDLNGDGSVDLNDINPFVGLLSRA